MSAACGAGLRMAGGITRTSVVLWSVPEAGSHHHPSRMVGRGLKGWVQDGFLSLCVPGEAIYRASSLHLFTPLRDWNCNSPPSPQAPGAVCVKTGWVVEWVPTDRAGKRVSHECEEV